MRQYNERLIGCPETTYQRGLNAKTFELAKERSTRLCAIVGNKENPLS